MRFSRPFLAPKIWSTITSGCEALTSRIWNPSSSFATESSRCLAAAFADRTGSSGDSTIPAMVAVWGAAFMAGVVAMEAGRSDRATSCETPERPLSSPMGKTPQSKLAQPKFFLSGQSHLPLSPSLAHILASKLRTVGSLFVHTLIYILLSDVDFPVLTCVLYCVYNSLVTPSCQDTLLHQLAM